MYAYIKGKTLELSNDYIVLEAGGIGYMIYCSGRTLRAIPLEDEAEVELFLEQRIRENDWSLYGFIDKLERQWFRSLSAVQGVGAKNTLAVLSAYAPSQLYGIITNADEANLTKVNGIGSRLARRITGELTTKVGNNADLHGGAVGLENKTPIGGGGKAANGAVTRFEVQQALQKMGFDLARSKQVALNAEQHLGKDAEIQELIKYALKELSL